MRRLGLTWEGTLWTPKVAMPSQSNGTSDVMMASMPPLSHFLVIIPWLAVLGLKTHRTNFPQGRPIRRVTMRSGKS